MGAMLTSRRRFLALGLPIACGACAIARGGTTPTRSDEASVERAAATEWETARPDTAGVSASVMDMVLERGAATPGLTSLIVVRHGVLIGERYYRGASASDLLPVRSVTKSITSLLVGLAVQRGSLRSVQEPRPACCRRPSPESPIRHWQT